LYEKNSGEERQSLTLPLNAAIIAALFNAEVKEKRLARKVLGLQILVTLIAAGIAAYSWRSSQQYAIAVLGGGGVSILNGALLAWRMFRAALHPNQDAHQQLRLMYFYAAERFLAVVVSLGICLAVLKLAPLGVLSGFALGQTALLSARLFLKIKTEDSD
jgi:F0F1-type ATP synthase assembly protein I